MDPNNQNNQHQLPQPDHAKLDPMVVLRPGERVICEIKRHPFGILSMYFSGLVAIVVAIVLAAFAPQIISTGNDVAANAMDTLAQFTKDGSFSTEQLVPLLKIQLQHKSSAVVRRATKILATLSA